MPIPSLFRSIGFRRSLAILSSKIENGVNDIVLAGQPGVGITTFLEELEGYSGFGDTAVDIRRVNAAKSKFDFGVHGSDQLRNDIPVKTVWTIDSENLPRGFVVNDNDVLIRVSRTSRSAHSIHLAPLDRSDIENWLTSNWIERYTHASIPRLRLQSIADRYLCQSDGLWSKLVQFDLDSVFCDLYTQLSSRRAAA